MNQQLMQLAKDPLSLWFGHDITEYAKNFIYPGFTLKEDLKPEMPLWWHQTISSKTKFKINSLNSTCGSNQ